MIDHRKVVLISKKTQLGVRTGLYYNISPPVKFGRRNRRDSVEGNKTLNTAQLSCITYLNFKASSVRENIIGLGYV